jgi:hypothetical protein
VSESVEAINVLSIHVACYQLPIAVMNMENPISDQMNGDDIVVNMDSMSRFVYEAFGLALTLVNQLHTIKGKFTMNVRSAKEHKGCGTCDTDIPRPTTQAGTETDYCVGPWDYSTWAARHKMV